MSGQLLARVRAEAVRVSRHRAVLGVPGQRPARAWWSMRPLDNPVTTPLPPGGFGEAAHWWPVGGDGR
jgi:hypothetical protein